MTQKLYIVSFSIQVLIDLFVEAFALCLLVIELRMTLVQMESIGVKNSHILKVFNMHIDFYPVKKKQIVKNYLFNAGVVAYLAHISCTYFVS